MIIPGLWSDLAIPASEMWSVTNIEAKGTFLSAGRCRCKCFVKYFQAENNNSGTKGGVSMLVDRSYHTHSNLSLFTALFSRLQRLVASPSNLGYHIKRIYQVVCGLK